MTNTIGSTALPLGIELMEAPLSLSSNTTVSWDPAANWNRYDDDNDLDDIVKPSIESLLPPTPPPTPPTTPLSSTFEPITLPWDESANWNDLDDDDIVSTPPLSTPATPSSSTFEPITLPWDESADWDDLDDDDIVSTPPLLTPTPLPVPLGPIIYVCQCVGRCKGPGGIIMPWSIKVYEGEDMTINDDRRSHLPFEFDLSGTYDYGQRSQLPFDPPRAFKKPSSLRYLVSADLEDSAPSLFSPPVPTLPPAPTHISTTPSSLSLLPISTPSLSAPAPKTTSETFPLFRAIAKGLIIYSAFALAAACF